jgi:type II secretory pathway component PulF
VLFRTAGLFENPLVQQTKIPQKQLAGFLRQMGSLLEAGLPVGTALMQLSGRRQGKGVSQLIARLQTSLEQGNSFGKAAGNCDGFVSPLYGAMLVAGETSGRLPELIRQVADLIEADIKRKRMRFLALLYPCCVMVMAMVLLAVLVGVVFPRFQAFFDSMGAELPAVTRGLISTMEAVRQALPWIAPGAMGLVVLVVLLHERPTGRKALDFLALKVSPFRSMHRKRATSNCARTLGLLQECGVPIVRSVRLAAPASGNRITEETLMKASYQVEQGNPLSEALGHPRFLVPEFILALRAGEQSGTLDQTLKRLADDLDAEVQHARSIRMTVGMILTILLLGGFVGWIVIAFMTAYFSLAFSII